MPSTQDTGTVAKKPLKRLLQTTTPVPATNARIRPNGVAQMAAKGRVQEGADADITIFDPGTVQDNATMRDGALPSSGIPYVLVNGTTMVRNSETVDGVFPGRAIRC